MIVLALNLATALRASLPLLANAGDHLPASAALAALDSLAPGATAHGHSPGPWQEGGGAHVGPNGVAANYIRDASGALLAYAARCYRSGSPHGNKQATASRVVACVNACEGTSTQALEALASDPAAAARLSVQLAEALRDAAHRGLVLPMGLAALAAYGRATASPASAEDAGASAWRAGGTKTSIDASPGVFDRFVRGADGETVLLLEGRASQARRDARRVAACINACASLSTEQVQALSQDRRTAAAAGLAA